MNILYRTMMVAFVVAGAVLLPLSLAAQDSDMLVSQSTVYTMADSETVEDAFSVLVRGEDEIAMMLHADSLIPDDTITVWWVIFNNPEACSDPCNADDFPQNGGDPAVNAAMIWADGRVVDADGRASFTGRLAVGDTSRAYGFETQGLQDIANAEVHIVARTHGPVITELLNEQLSTLNGGCENGTDTSGMPGANTCANLLASLHFAS